MSIRLVIDMNLSAEWIGEFVKQGWHAEHWSTIGDPQAEDSEIIAWAIESGAIVFTHDLDFGATLALTAAAGPSVIQVRGPYVLPEDIGPLVIATIRQYEAILSAGALAIVDPAKVRVRILPLNRET
jgi:predicted nuclease of predicted toxin-antitoxin system